MEHIHTLNSEGLKVTDPVCGMKVDPATAKFSAQYQGKNYFFCCAGCLAKFQANPEKILSAPPIPMGSGMVSLGMVKGIAPAAGKPATPGADARIYVCPMCPEVRQEGPGPCPKCGMALDPESPAAPATKTEWTCPMHPEIVRSAPGSCPICGMALEPRTIMVAEEENSELRGMTRRLWVSAVLTVPLLVIAMGSMVWPKMAMKLAWEPNLPWIELFLATPVVLWCGWPFFQRGWTSVVNRS